MMFFDWWPSIHGLRSVNPFWGHHVCHGRDLHGSAGLGPQRGRGQAKVGYPAAPRGGSWQTRNIRTYLGRQCRRGSAGGSGSKGANPAAGQLPRIHYSQLIYKQGNNLAVGQTSARPPGVNLHSLHDFSMLVYLGRLGLRESSIWVDGARDHFFFYCSSACFGLLSGVEYMGVNPDLRRYILPINMHIKELIRFTLYCVYFLSNQTAVLQVLDSF